jgi:hypothetical protein
MWHDAHTKFHKFPSSLSLFIKYVLTYVASLSLALIGLLQVILC